MKRNAVTPWGVDSSDDSDDEAKQLLDRNGANYQATQQLSEEDVIRQHEQGLDKLGEAIKRQKYMAAEIATEVEVHNEIIDNIDDGLTKTSDNLRKNTRNINLVMKKSSTFCLWIMILLLGIVIIVLAVL